MGTGGGPYSTRVQYSDGRTEYIETPSTYQAGDVLAITHRRDGGVVAQRVSPVALYSAGIEVYTRQSGLTPGATSQIRFSAKIDVVPPSSEEDYIYARVGWHYTQAYDGHYSSEYDMPMNGSELSTVWDTYYTPEFIAPNGGGLFFNFNVYPYEMPASRLPIYFDAPEILIGGSWVAMPGWSWSSQTWDYNSPTGDGWQKYIIYGDIDADISAGYLKISYT